MSEARSALDGAAFDGSVRVEEAGLRGMISLKGDLGDTGVKSAATGVAGVDMPGPLSASAVGDRALLWMAPDELLILLPRGEAGDAVATIRTALAGTHHLAADVSDARAVFGVTGARARETLQKLTPADLRPAAFGPGHCRRTRLAQVPAALWMVDETRVDLVCFRSVARYVFDLISNAARPGAEVEHF